jgi:hypothetical protein
MRLIKTYEGFFNFFKKLDSEDDKIALEYINRLKKVKGISPYSIKTNDQDQIDQIDRSFSILRYQVNFDDTPIKCAKVISHRSGGFDNQSQEFIISNGGIKKNSAEFYILSVIVEDEKENIKASPSLLKELYHLIDDIYKKDKELRRIDKIKRNLNKASDLLD